jgi:hypothetical protein
VDPKMIFTKNQELVLLELKGKPSPVPTKSAGLRKIQKITPKVCAMKRELICVS